VNTDSPSAIASSDMPPGPSAAHAGDGSTIEAPSRSRSLILRNVPYPALDGLRIYCALLIFLVHSIGLLLTEYFHIRDQDLGSDLHNRFFAFLVFISNDSHFGLDVLFVVSGFLMAHGVFNRKEGWPEFVGKRFLRLYPAFLVSMVVITAIDCRWIGYTFDLHDFALNLVLWNAVLNAEMIRYNYVTWALGFEFAFYLVVPLIGYAARIIDRRAAALMALAAAFAFIPDVACRMDGLFVGLFVGSFDKEFLGELGHRIPAAMVVIACLVLVSIKDALGLTYLAYYRILLLLIAAGVISVVYGENWLKRVLSKPTPRKLGTISYSFYLYHSICLVLVLRFVLVWMGIKDDPRIAVPAYFTLSLLLTVAVSLLSYRLLEAPYFRAQSRKRAARQATRQLEAVG
jgi:peptidoglycan/LPS O-acetylase OafA/YrhL